MRKSPLIGVLVPAKRNYYADRYGGYSPPDVRTIVFTPKQINWVKRYVHASYVDNGVVKTKRFPFPEAVFNKFYTGNRTIARKLESRIGQGKCFNLITRFQKWDIHQLLLRSSLLPHLPETRLLNRTAIIEMLARYTSIIIKPVSGSLGKGIYMAAMTSNGEVELSYQKKFSETRFSDVSSFAKSIVRRLRGKAFIVQQMIDLSRVFRVNKTDIRVLVHRNGEGEWQITAELVRVAQSGYFVTNMIHRMDSLGELLKQICESTAEREQKLKEIYEVSLETASHLERCMGHLGELGIDVGIDVNGHVWIIEVNGNPSKVMFEEYGDKKILELAYRIPLEYAAYLARKDVTDLAGKR